jgi:hypothetical protein
MRDSLFPFLVLDVQVVVLLVFVAPAPYMQEEQGLRMPIGLAWVVSRRWEAQDQFEVNGVL